MPFPIVGGGPGDHFGAAIPFACRFNDDDTAHLSRTPGGSPTSTTIWTFSTWFKRGAIDIPVELFSAGTGGAETGIQIDIGGGVSFFQSTVSNVTTDMLFRDPSAWYHLVIGYDSNAGASADRIKIEVNGVVASFTEANPIDSARVTDLNSTDAHYLFRRITNQFPFDGYIAETIVVDGQKLDASNFGQFNPITGGWVPKSYTGTYGNNGFHLDYANAADLGNDVSGNANDWTSSGLATNDQVADTPTNNHCTLNPVDAMGNAGTLSNGNMAFAGPTGLAGAKGTIWFNSGKWYWEVEPSTYGNIKIGLCNDQLDLDAAGDVGVNANGAGGRIGNGSTSVFSYDGSTTNVGTINGSDVLGIAVDFDAATPTVKYYENNALIHTETLSSYVAGEYWTPCVKDETGAAAQAATLLFNSDDWAYTKLH